MFILEELKISPIVRVKMSEYCCIVPLVSLSGELVSVLLKNRFSLAL